MKGYAHGTKPLLFAVLAVAINPAFAENPCKGMSQSACEGNDSCTWVSGYQSKSGKEVKAYCRLKPKNKPENSGKSG